MRTSAIFAPRRGASIGRVIEPLVCLDRAGAILPGKDLILPIGEQFTAAEDECGQSSGSGLEGMWIAVVFGGSDSAPLRESISVLRTPSYVMRSNVPSRPRTISSLIFAVTSRSAAPMILLPPTPISPSVLPRLQVFAVFFPIPTSISIPSALCGTGRPQRGTRSRRGGGGCGNRRAHAPPSPGASPWGAVLSAYSRPQIGIPVRSSLASALSWRMVQSTSLYLPLSGPISDPVPIFRRPAVSRAVPVCCTT